MNDSKDTLPKVNVRVDIDIGIGGGCHYLTVDHVEQEDDGSFTAVVKEKP